MTPRVPACSLTPTTVRGHINRNQMLCPVGGGQQLEEPGTVVHLRVAGSTLQLLVTALESIDDFLTEEPV